MKLFIAGQKLFGAATLALCLDRGHEVVGVCSPATAVDGERVDRLRAAAERASVPWQQSGSLRAETLPGGIDLILSAHAHDFIGRPTRGRARLGAIGYHPSLLPLHRGRDAIEWVIRMRERVTGGTVYWLGDSVDGGDVAAQEHVFVKPGDDARELWRRELFPLGLRLFAEVLDDLSEGRITRQPQDQDVATWEPSVGRAPIFRPELPLLGVIPGFEVVRRARVSRAARASLTPV